MSIIKGYTPGLAFDEDKHEYRFQGAVVPSVTQVLTDNRFIDHTFYTEEAKVRGTRVHLLCEFFDRHVYDPNQAERFGLAGYVESWRKFMGMTSLGILDVERLMAHPVYRFGGRPDRLARIGRATWIIDLKTGGPELWHPYQLGGYEELYLVNGVGGPLRRMSVHLREDGSLASHVEYDDMNDRHHFLSFLNATNQRRKHGIH